MLFIKNKLKLVKFIFISLIYIYLSIHPSTQFLHSQVTKIINYCKATTMEKNSDWNRVYKKQLTMIWLIHSFLQETFTKWLIYDFGKAVWIE